MLFFKVREVFSKPWDPMSVLIFILYPCPKYTNTFRPFCQIIPSMYTLAFWSVHSLLVSLGKPVMSEAVLATLISNLALSLLLLWKPTKCHSWWWTHKYQIQPLHFTDRAGKPKKGKEFGRDCATTGIPAQFQMPRSVPFPESNPLYLSPVWLSK